MLSDIFWPQQGHGMCVLSGVSVLGALLFPGKTIAVGRKGG